jgi:hypothetical protein
VGGNGNSGIMISGGSFKAGQVAVGSGASASLKVSGGNVALQGEGADEAQGATSGANACECAQIDALLAQLKELLKLVPEEHKDVAEAMTTQADQLVKASLKPEPNRPFLKMMTEGLSQTLSYLRETAPEAAAVAGNIVVLIGRLHQLGL